MFHPQNRKPTSIHLCFYYPNEKLSMELFADLFNSLFDLGKEMEGDNTDTKLNIMKFNELKQSVKQILG